MYVVYQGPGNGKYIHLYSLKRNCNFSLAEQQMLFPLTTLLRIVRTWFTSMSSIINCFWLILWTLNILNILFKQRKAGVTQLRQICFLTNMSNYTLISTLLEVWFPNICIWCSDTQHFCTSITSFSKIETFFMPKNTNVSLWFIIFFCNLNICLWFAFVLMISWFQIIIIRSFPNNFYSSLSSEVSQAFE